MARSKDKTPSRKKKPSKVATVIKSIFLMGLLMAAFLVIYAGSVIAQAPEIDTSNIYAFMSESSTLYDDQGNVIDSVFTEGGNRVNLTYDEMPTDLINAVVAMEDKSFWEHHGFNIIRIFGAIKEKLVGGGQISGTSTITQQLARNIYLADIKSERSLNRKITEAWYAVILERNLTKEQIIEAYLNTIYLGYNCYGVEAAANAYFNKSAKDLDLVQCVALAAVPQNPQNYAPLRTYASADFATISETIDPSYIIKESDGYVTVYNGESSAWRRETTLKYMEEQGYITADQKAAAMETDLLSEIDVPKEQHLSNSYFNDFVINEVIDDLVESGYTEENARKLIYTGGLQIYTTLNQQAQDAIETAFNDPDNFPSVEYYNNQQDDNGNIYNKDGDKIILYAKDKMFEDDVFYFKDGEFTLNDDGSVTYKMTKKQHRAMLENIGKAVDEGAQEMIDDEENYTISAVTHNEDCTEYNVTLDGTEGGFDDYFACYSFFMYGMLYGKFSGHIPEHIVVNYYDPDGNLIETMDSAELEDSEDTQEDEEYVNTGENTY